MQPEVTTHHGACLQCNERPALNGDRLCRECRRELNAILVGASQRGSLQAVRMAEELERAAEMARELDTERDAGDVDLDNVRFEEVIDE